MRTTILVVALLLQSIVSFAQDADQLIREGVALHDQGKYQEAIEKYDAALEADNNNLTALTEKAMTLYYIKEYEKTIDLCRVAIEKHPEHEDLKMVYPIYANALDANGDSEAAIEAYDEGIALFPDYYQLHFNKGVTLSGMKNYEDALLSFEESAKLNPQHASTQNAIGRIQYDLGQKIPSLMALLRCVSLELETSRTEVNLHLIDKIINGAITKTGKNSVSINLDLGTVAAEGEEEDTLTKPNDFQSTYMILVFSAVIGSKKKQTEAEQFSIRMSSLCTSLSSGAEENFGFYWEYYAPYFIDMKDNDVVEAFSYIMMSTSGQKDVKKWLKKNPDKVEAFHQWNINYDWQKE